MGQIEIKSVREVLRECRGILRKKLGREPTEKEMQTYLKRYGVNIEGNLQEVIP